MDDIANYAENNVAFRMLLQLDPTGIGSVVDVFLTDLHDKFKKRRINELFSKIGSGKVRITKEMIDSDEFLYAFFATTNAVINSRKTEKINLFANLLINGINLNKYQSDQFEQFLKILEEVTYQEIQIIEILYELEKGFPVELNIDGSFKPANTLQRAEEIWGKFEKKIAKRLGIKPAFLKDMLTRLNRTGLFENVTGTVWNYEGGKGSTTSLYKEFRKWVLENENNH